MAKRRVVIKDLAEKMDLSVSTISRALNNHSSIGVKTTEKVKKVAKEMGYFPNTVAANLRTNKSRAIGVIVPRIDVHFHSKAISGIEDVAYRYGYNVSIFQSNNSQEREVSITSILQTRMVEGNIVCLGLSTDDTSHFDVFKKQEVPIVFFDRVPQDPDTNKVIINDFSAAFEATEHLISIGCKNIAHIAGNQSTDIFKHRLEGYKSALKKYNLPVNEKLIAYTKKLNYECGVESANIFLSQQLRPDGLFCANDYTAISAIQTFIKNDYRVPEDIAIVGFSNYPISEFIEPTLTTVDDDAYEMGRNAAKLLFRKIKDDEENVVSETIVMRTRLIKRNSTLGKNKK